MIACETEWMKERLRETGRERERMREGDRLRE